ncbi:MAG: hypothetical protein ABFQ65_04190 [Nanoarchaeota archaeon]
MNFEDCLKNKSVKKVSSGKEAGKSLLKLVEARLIEVKKIENPTLKVEAYYEILKELITILLFNEGYKSYSHECLISFLKRKFSDKLSLGKIELINQLRLLRNDIAYRGIFVEKDYLNRNEKEILIIINLLKDLAKNYRNLTQKKI